MASPAEKKSYKKGFKAGADSVEEGLPGWFGTFADMMTLLFAFFVLLAAISTIDPVKLQEMADSMGKKVGKTSKEGKAMNLADIKKAADKMVKDMPADKTGKKPVEVRTGPKGVTIGISSDISFASGTADLQQGIIDVLKKLVPTIKDPNNYFPVAVEGHSDNDPLPEKFHDKYPSNWELSAARASAVFSSFRSLNDAVIMDSTSPRLLSNFDATIIICRTFSISSGAEPSGNMQPISIRSTLGSEDLISVYD